MIDIEIDMSSFGAGQRKFMLCRDPFVGFFGGFGSGKSTALMWKMLQLAIENHGLPGLLIAQSFGALYANIVEPFIAMLRNCGVPSGVIPKINTGRYPKLDFPNGSVVHLRSAEHPEGYDGLTVAWLAGDEIRHWRKRAYEIAIARVRIKKANLIQRVFSSTPAMNWVNDEFNAGLQRTLIHAPTIENEHNLAEGYIDGLRASYSKRLQRAVLDGMFTALEGSVFEDFDPSSESPWFVNLAPSIQYLEPRKNFLAVDPGYRHSAWLWCVENDDCDWIIYDQLMGETMNDSACVSEVNRRGWPIDEIWVDPAGKAKQSYEGMSTMTALGSVKARTRDPIRTLRGANRDIAYGIDKMRVLFGDDRGDRPIRMRFAKRLIDMERGKPRGIVKDISCSSYPEKKDNRPVDDLPVKDGVHDHGRDALRYLMVGLWLTTDKLRRLDPILNKQRDPGYNRIAA